VTYFTQLACDRHHRDALQKRLTKAEFTAFELGARAAEREEEEELFRRMKKKVPAQVRGCKPLLTVTNEFTTVPYLNAGRSCKVIWQ
jgi:hypothetical protein